MPYEIITTEEARRRKREEGAYFVPGQNGVMCAVPRLAFTPLDADSKPKKRDRSQWKVVGQTAKPGIRHKPTAIGPGFPQYALV